jgi:N-acetylneuraminic acid mutarotase
MPKRLTLFIISVLLLSACTPAATPTAAPRATSAPAALAATRSPLTGTSAPDLRPPLSGGPGTPPTLGPKQPDSQPNSIKRTKGWQQLGSIKIPPARSDHILIDAGNLNRLVLFGGRSASAASGASGVFSDTWIYDLAANAWRPVTSSIVPAARYGLAAAYDPLSQHVLMFGGQAGTKFFNDVWAFNVITEQWNQVKISGPAPAARSGTAAIVDPQLNQLIISHGATAASRLDDTWALDLIAKVWQNVSPATHPAARSQHTATFDEIHHRFILFGGLDATGQISNEQWSFDPSALVWKRFGTIDASNPAPRSGSAIVYEPITHIIYLFGGKTFSGATNEVWSLDPSNHWAPINFSSGPSARSSHAATWDTINNRLIVFGGVDANNKPLNDLWAYTP